MHTIALLLNDGRFPSGGHAHSSGLEAAVAAGRVTDLSALEHFLVGRLATTALVAAAFTAATHAAVAAATGAAAAAAGQDHVNFGEPDVITAQDPGAFPESDVISPAAILSHGAGTDASADLRASASVRTPPATAGASAGSQQLNGHGRPAHLAPPSVVELVTTPPELPATLAELDAELDARTASPALRLASRRQGRALLRAGKTIWPHGNWQHLPQHPDGPHQPIALGITTAAAGLTTEEAALTSVYGTLSGLASAAVRLQGLDPYRIQALLTRLAPICDTTAAAAAQAAGTSPAELPAASAPLADISAELHATWEVRLFAS
ncbi:urease accessory protein [Allocatelliglobosispora scoriae]|uniref:Urease accessory protein UreF n=1 Tax=Allocatelliglobosispora scoriae TaxID=643052 RepID=A0A841BXX3_9ACTN|nr:urease accessory UreF family protein [Allocatelliglobosispora scoriae]MBB5872386.1 urease accessory protein [Allocatelliglobosispora scoriae]